MPVLVAVLITEVAAAADAAPEPPQHVLTAAWLPAVGASVRLEERVARSLGVFADLGAQRFPLMGDCSEENCVDANVNMRWKIGFDLRPVRTAPAFYLAPGLAVHRSDDSEQFWLPAASDPPANWQLAASGVMGLRSVSRAGLVLQVGAGAAWLEPLGDSERFEPVNPVIELRLGWAWWRPAEQP
jgi:hypothetical protein